MGHFWGGDRIGWYLIFLGSLEGGYSWGYLGYGSVEQGFSVFLGLGLSGLGVCISNRVQGIWVIKVIGRRAVRVSLGFMVFPVWGLEF